MTPPRIVLRARAARDIDDAITHITQDAGLAVSVSFVDAVQRACDELTRQPRIGSPRFAHELGLPGLRTWPVDPFPFLVFYVVRDGTIDVWRVLHTRRDIPEALQGPEEWG